jgi:hypothetical protein
MCPRLPRLVTTKREEQAYLRIRCIACNQVHHANQITGKVLGVDDDE